MQYSGFKGKQMSFDLSVGTGVDRKSGNVGVIKTVFNSETYKQPVREYLKSCGYKEKTGFWSRLFG